MQTLLSSHPDVRNVVPAEHVNEVGDGVEAGQGVGVGDMHGAQVGGLAGGNRADLVVEAEGAGAVEGGHAQGAVGGQGCGVAGGELGEQAGLLHLAEEVEAVVAGGAVGAKADVEALVEQAGDRCGAAGELHVGGRAVGDRAAMEGEAFDVAVVQVAIDEGAVHLHHLLDLRCRDRRSTPRGGRPDAGGGKGRFLDRVVNLVVQAGTTSLSAILAAYTAAGSALAGNALINTAIVLLLVGALSKSALVPFHFWTADTYQGAPTTVTGYLSVISKGAAAFTLLSILYHVFGTMIMYWQVLVMIVVVLLFGLP